MNILVSSRNMLNYIIYVKYKENFSTSYVNGQEVFPCQGY